MTSNTGAQALADGDGSTRVGPYAEAQFLMSDIESSLLKQLVALYADDNAMYQEAKLDFNALYIEVPTVVRTQPITQGDDVIDPIIPPQPK